MNYRVFVNRQELNILTATVCPPPYNEMQTMEYALFGISDPVDIIIESKIEINNAVIRPLSLRLDYSFDQHKIVVHLEKPMNFSVEINDSYNDNILIFANSKRDEKVNASAPNVVYFPKGEHVADIISVTQNDTLIYLEEGAYVHGKLKITGCKNITICGSGVLSMERYPRNSPEEYEICVDVMECQNINIRDIVISDSIKWSLRMMGCDHVHINNVKIIGSRGNSDGIDICGSRDVMVENCFTRVWDDSLVVKAFDTGDVDKVVFKNCILWNDFARPMEVGVELRAEKVKDVRFENIDIIHSLTGYPIMGIHHGDRAQVSDIIFENIRIEDAPGAQLFDIRITDSVWNTDIKKGNIKDISFKNIFLIGKPGIDFLPSKSRLQGFSEESNIENITFENINLLGKVAATTEACNILCMAYVKNVVVKCDETKDKLNLINTTLVVTENFILQQNGYYKGKIKIGADNLSETKEQGRIWLQISPGNTAVYDSEPMEFSLTANQGAYKEYEVLLPAGKYGLCIQSDRVNIKGAWQLINLDWVVYETKNLQDAYEYSFVNYYHIKNKGVKVAVWNDHLLLQAELLKQDNSELVIYTAMPVPTQIGEVKFTVEETDFGMSMAVIQGENGLELAPQLRCPEEITFVFQSEPKVKEIRVNVMKAIQEEIVKIPFEKLGIEKGTKHFWMEIEAKIPEVLKYRYPYTLFHSVNPKNTAHMFVDVKIKSNR